MRSLACEVFVWLALAGCSASSPPGRGQIVVALTIDWEGAYLSPDGLGALDELRDRLPGVPITHFVSAAYFTKQHPDPDAAALIAEAIRPGDEVAVHLHVWNTLAAASGLEPKLSPSFLTGTEDVLEFEDGDTGFDTDLDVYTASELKALLRTSRELLAPHVTLSTSFRAGGYLGTPRVLQAIRDEGFTVDSSAVDHRMLDADPDRPFPQRIAQLWPGVDTAKQPWLIPLHGGELVEMPLAAVADYATADQIAGVLDAARLRLPDEPHRDVYVVLGFHQENADELAPRITEALDVVRARTQLADQLTFTTVEQAAARARLALAPQ